MNARQTALYKKTQRLVESARIDLERHDRVDALDALRMAQRALRDSMGELAVFLPKITELVPMPGAKYSVVVTFETELTPTQRSVARYTLNQLVAR